MKEISTTWWLGVPPPPHLQLNIHHIAEPSALPDQQGLTLCISFDNQAQIDDAIRQVFEIPSVWSWHIIVTEETALSRCTCDGLFGEKATNVPSHGFRIGHNQTNQDRLLAWLMFNQERLVKPLKNVNSPSIYSYPIIQLLHPELRAIPDYIRTLKQKGVLDQGALVDRTRACKQCSSSHLNYIEVCPQCSSIDLDTLSALHCFTCGHVSDQKNFLHRGKLECPKCLTQLRHIGVDYDRPLEQYQCNECGSSFVEPDTQCQCFTCGHSCSLDELTIHKIYQYQLGEKGRHIYLNGEANQTPELSIKGKVDEAYFSNLLVWINTVALRHNQHHLLLGLSIPIIEDTDLHIGDSKLYNLMEQLSRYLSNVFRDTDICCQYRHDILLIFMPHTPIDQIKVLENKFSQLSDIVEEENLELDVFAWSLPDESMRAGISLWLAARIGEIYAAR